jgi:hypothetical protein
MVHWPFEMTAWLAVREGEVLDSRRLVEGVDGLAALANFIPVIINVTKVFGFLYLSDRRRQLQGLRVKRDQL